MTEPTAAEIRAALDNGWDSRDRSFHRSPNQTDLIDDAAESWADLLEAQERGEAIVIRKTEVFKALRDAVENQGPHPDYHRQIMSRHRREWPTLWRAIDGVLDALEARQP